MSVHETLKAIAKWRIDAIQEDPEAVFVSEDQIDDFIETPPAFVIGKKGTGKTAFATKLATKFSQNVHHVSFAEIHDTYADIQRHQKHNDASTREVAIQLAACLCALRKWAKNSKRPLTLRMWESIFSRVQRPAFLPAALAALVSIFVKTTSSPSGVEVSEVKVDFSNIRFHLNNTRMLRDYVAKVLRSVKSSGQDVYLFIDGIDDLECFNKSPFDPAAMDLLRAFIQGTHNWVQGPERPIKLIALVRPEFLDLADLPNIREKIEDNALKLEWNEQSLFSMLTHRLEREVEAMLERSKERGGYARRIGTRELFGRSESEHREIVTRLFNYSFLRPRDVIRYAKFVAEYALKHDAHQPLPLAYFDRILDKQRRYLLHEMQAELALTLPHYQRFIQMLMHVNAANEDRLFLKREYFEAEVESAILAGALPIDVREVMWRLYSAFAIGFRGAGNSRHFNYETDIPPFSETNQVVLHNLFREVPRDALLIEFADDEPEAEEVQIA